MGKPSMDAKPRKPSDKAIIREQARRISELTREAGYMEDCFRRHKDWLRQAKRDAGYPDRVSFDVVWAKALEAMRVATPGAPQDTAGGRDG